ncbi:MAG: hypothetical protein ACR2PZ_23985 [Pseudomonadales bacterium]
MINNNEICLPLWRLAAALGLLLVAGCDPRQPSVRGPNSEPVDRIEASSLSLPIVADGSNSGARPLVPNVTDDPDTIGPTPAPEQLLQAFRSIATQGLSVRLVPAVQSGAAIALVVELSLEQFMPVLLAQDGSTDGIAALTTEGATVVLGSPFVAEFSPLQPLGLLQLDGRLVSELQPHGYTRVLGLRSDSVGVVGRGEFHRGLFDAALQVGPGIIENGRLDISTRELKLPAYYRTFLVSCGSQILVGASTQPLHLRTLGEALLAFAQSQGLSCDEAVNLSGDREVLLAVRNSREAVIYGNPRVKKTALIGFLPKPKL